MENKSVVNSKELAKLLKTANDTLKHWRYGYYISKDSERIYYCEDKSSVPCKLIVGKSFSHYEYNLYEVAAWIKSWQTKSQKKISILKKLAVVGL